MIAAAALLVLLTPAHAQSQATTSNLPFTIPFAPMFVPCANGGLGENVVFSGNLQGTILLTIDADGGIHTDTRFNATGVVGVGQVTGHKYQGVGATQHHFNFRGTAPFEATFASDLNLIGQGPGNNLKLHSTVHVTFDANGVLDANVSNTSATCS